MVKRTAQKGAIMLELLTVLMLLGAIGPMLFRQIKDRNEDVHNINYAAEIRAAKEGFLAYIIANQGTLQCTSDDATNVTADAFTICDSFNTDNLKSYMPGSELPENFDFVLNATRQSSSSEHILYQGFVIPKTTPTLNLRRAARIANLIGVDGGIYLPYPPEDTTGKSVIMGSLGSWEASPDGIVDGSEITYVATTGLHAYAPRTNLDPIDIGSTYVSGDLAFQKLHASSYFSVGGGPDGCYTSNSDGSFTIQEAKNCDPLFWVEEDKEKKGKVHVRNNMYIGKTDSSTNASIELTSEEIEDDTTKKTIAKGKIKIKGTGTDGEDDTLTIADGEIVSARKTPDGDNYKLDPSRASVMNDIKLASRGNARLSKILPKYIAKDVVSIEGTGTVFLKHTIEKPADCIEGGSLQNKYVPAIIVTPTRWDSAAVDSDSIPLGLSVEIDDKASSVDASGTPLTSTGKSWTVKIGYKTKNAAVGSDFKTTKDATQITAIAQTFCVWNDDADGINKSYIEEGNKTRE